ncbi:MAG: CRISPR-associated endonuclease Cas3'' [Pseudomonadota bacterium]
MFYAHSYEGLPEERWQLLSEHLNGVASLAGRGTFHSDICHTLGLLHDLGKYTEGFQARLRNDPKKVDHSTAGAQLACERYGLLGQLMAYALAGHHAGLANGKRVDSVSLTPLFEATGGRLTGGRGEKLLGALDEVWKQEIGHQLPQVSDLGRFSLHPSLKRFSLPFFVRYLLSCLVDADYEDTGRAEASALGRPYDDVQRPGLHQLKEALDGHMNGFQRSKPIHEWRHDILSEARRKAKARAGVFTMTVPTGGGKTLSSMSFALDHAINHGLDRVIYVIPYTSIIEQNASVFREAFGVYGDAAIIEHHSNFDMDSPKDAAMADDADTPDNDRDRVRKLRRVMERWDAPVIVTTSVQFFETLFSNRPSQLRKLRRMTNSVIVLDEVQSLPLKLLQPCVAALRELSDSYSSSVVLCTATQPALTDNGSDKGFRGGFQATVEIAPDPEALYERFKRVEVRREDEPLSDDALGEVLRGRDQVLCIVSTKRHAAALFERIADAEGAYYLTTELYPKHRSARLAEIRQALRDGMPCRLISTSLIEAGVDLDFPAVYRAECGIESLAQAAGRCNREGKLERGEVVWFRSAEEHGNIRGKTSNSMFADMERRVKTAEDVFRDHADPFSLSAIKQYFEGVYWRNKDELGQAMMALHQREIDSIPFETIAREFRLIEQEQKSLIIARESEPREIVDRLWDESISVRDAARKLGPYSVSVYDSQFTQLVRESEGLVEFIRPELYGDQFALLRTDLNPELYLCERGLSLNRLGIVNGALVF